MRAIHYTLLFIACIGVSTANAADITGRNNYTATIEQSVPFPAGGTVDVKTPDGRINVSAWDKPEVGITAKKVVQTWSGEDRGESLLEEIEIDVTTDGNVVRVEARFPKIQLMVGMAVHFEIQLPADGNLVLKTSDGHVEVGGIRGHVAAKTSDGNIQCDSPGSAELQTSDGSITCNDSAGAVQARTSDGDIEIRRTTGSVLAHSSDGDIVCETASGAVDVHTNDGSIQVVLSQNGALSEAISCSSSDGRIDLTLAQNPSFELSARTSDGRINVDFPVTAKGETKKNQLTGTVGAGGPLVELKSSDGSIFVHQS